MVPLVLSAGAKVTWRRRNRSARPSPGARRPPTPAFAGASQKVTTIPESQGIH